MVEHRGAARSPLPPRPCMTAGQPLLITGATGFIGRRVVALAQARGLAVLAPPRAEVDWADRSAAAGYLGLHRPGAIVHLASPGVFAPNPDDPALEMAECVLIDNLLDHAIPGCRIISGGSMAEYGIAGRLDEGITCQPTNAYARAKHTAGLRLVEALERGDVTGCHARIFGAFGTGEAPRRLFPSVVAALRQGEAVDLSDGLQWRDFVHVDDVARALLDLAAAPVLPDPVVNVGTGSAVTVRSAVERVAHELHAPPGLLRFGAVARSVHDQDKLEAETARLRAAIGWVPQQRFASPAPILPLL